MSDPHTSLFAWPGWRNLAYGYGVLGPLLLFWFVLIYAGANYLTGLHSYRIPLQLSFERHVPFVPAMVLFYNSLHVTYLVVPFILRDRREMNALVIVWIVLTFCGGMLFLLLPAENFFPVPTDEALGPWRTLFRLADRANLEYNMCPSLHVAWAVAAVDVYARKAGQLGSLLLWLWAIGLAASTMLIHQHYVIDALSGTLLAMVATRFLYPQLLARQQQE